MKISKMLREYRNDFSADLVCEHCGAVAPNVSGYHDNYFHTQVIPAKHCENCGKNRAGAHHDDALEAKGEERGR